MTRLPRLALATAATALAVVAASAPVDAAADAAPDAALRAGDGPGPVGALAPSGEARGTYDARAVDGATDSSDAGPAAVSPADRTAATRLVRALGPAGVLDLDPATGTVRMLADRGGYLTGVSGLPAAGVARGYVATHHDALGLTAADVRGLRLSRDYVDVLGTHHLSFVQRAGGLPVFGNGLTAAVTRTGRLLMVGGSPTSTPSTPPAAGDLPDVAGPAAALADAHRRAGDPASLTVPSDADETATPVAFVADGHTYRAWQTVTTSGASPALTVVDAATGRLLYRRAFSDDAGPEPSYAAGAALQGLARARQRSDERAVSRADAKPGRHGRHGRHGGRKPGTGLVFTYFPHAPRGGSYRRVDFAHHGWISRTAKILKGNNAHTWSDVKDDDKAGRSEEVHPTAGHTWDRRLEPFHLKGVSFCGRPYPCNWNPNQRYSWRTNRAQNATQVFFFVNNWHDHLASKPIGFTEAAGNFEAVNHSHKGKGGDPVHAQSDDGADTVHGLPDGSHVDNANMDTPPDGHSPRMQMYLQHVPHTSYPKGDPFAPTNVGDEADTVYHEYTHGLSNRLVVDARGHSTLGQVQAGAMGEAWSDWYAMDYLVDHHLQKDAAHKVDVVLFQYDGAGVKLDRSEPLDCPLGSTSARCPGGDTGHRGGYSYADYGHVTSGPEVHADGEIWSQTLWTLRHRLGSTVTESIVTRAMELSPANPSFLDERDAIELADTEAYGGRHLATIRSTFAQRGMGFYAGSLGGNDSTPAPDFHTTAISSQTGTISGTVTDSTSGQPLAGVTVTLTFQGGGSLTNPSATTDSTGHYSLGPVPVGHYAELHVGGAGFQPVSTPVDVVAGGTTRDAAVARDWAAIDGGAKVTSFDGPDFGPNCGPAQALDLNQASAWGSTTGDNDGNPTNTFVPKSLTVQLPKPITVTSFAVDPAAGCGDGASASTGAYTIAVSTDGTTFSDVASGTFASADDGRLNTVTPTGSPAAVRYVRFTIRGNQTPGFATSCPGGSFSGCSFTDLSEFEVLGTP